MAGEAIITRIANQYGLTRHDAVGRQWNTISSATDLMRSLHMTCSSTGPAGSTPEPGQDHRQQPYPVHPHRNRWLSSAFRHPDRPVCRTDGGYAERDYCCIVNDWMHMPTEVE
ncbi:hypothetical protein A3216_03840 [Mycobacterium leprae 7935681]|nr:hypothetical protein A3216_03840 [Mycobacterium leprae 7935681]